MLGSACLKGVVTVVTWLPCCYLATVIIYEVTIRPAGLYTNLYNNYVEGLGQVTMSQVRSLKFYMKLPAGQIATTYSAAAGLTRNTDETTIIICTCSEDIPQ